MISVKQSSKYHSKIGAKYKILQLFKADGKEKIMLRPEGCALAFQCVRIPVGRHS